MPGCGRVRDHLRLECRPVSGATRGASLRVRPHKRICGGWNVGKAPAGHGYLDSSLPVLTLRGECDTAPDDAGRILTQARHFPNGFTYTFPNRGPVLLRSGSGSASCPRSIAAHFLAQPGNSPDARCIANMARTVFAVP